MCSPSWPTSIEKPAFVAYAKDRGWSDDQIEKAWLWCTTRQNKTNIERIQERERKRKEADLAEAMKADRPCVCQCPRCKAASS